MNRAHDENCNCSICNNGIREEVQYAAWRLGNNYIIIDAEEYGHFEKYMEIDKDKRPEYKQVEPADDTEPVLAYGVLIPQCDSKVKDWDSALDKYRNYAFGTLTDEKLYVSAYSDYKMFTDNVVYENHIPCALLLDTALDLTKEREYGFGYTMFLLFKDMDVLENILNREFLFCIRGIEEKFNAKECANWEIYIDREKMINISKRLF